MEASVTRETFKDALFSPDPLVSSGQKIYVIASTPYALVLIVYCETTGIS
jgi:hypothetical protein